MGEPAFGYVSFMKDIEITETLFTNLQKENVLREALLADYSKSPPQCNICQRRCVIPAGKTGFCNTIINHKDTLYTTIYGVVSSAGADPIEKKPVFHYKPGTLVFSVGTLGCNFRCAFCQNYEIAYTNYLSSHRQCKTGIMPEDLVRSATNLGCEGVAWTYNEPGIWLNYSLDSAKLCKDSGLYTIWVTNGYSTPEALDEIGPYLDVFRVDIKSMRDDFYKKTAQVPGCSGIREVTKQAKHKWNMHVECVTNIVPGWNDDEENISETINWIRDEIGPDTPWHITAFFPHSEFSHVPPTPLETLEWAYNKAKTAGLMFPYLGNVSANEMENTYCPTCSSASIKRSRYNTTVLNVDENGRCTKDQTPLNIHM